MVASTYVIIGGGIAGVSCAEQVSSLCPEESVTLVTASPLIKVVTNVKRLTRSLLEEFDVEEQSIDYLSKDYPNISVILSLVTGFNAEKHEVYTADGQCIKYKKLCICSGGQPKVISQDHPLILGIRDTETVQVLQDRLQKARRVIVVGNGGIATEITYEIEGCQVIWAVKDSSIGATFFDAGAAEFFLPHLTKEKDKSSKPLKRRKYAVSGSSVKTSVPGTALGPDWSGGLAMSGSIKVSRDVHVEYESEVRTILSPEEFLKKAIPANLVRNIEEGKDWPVYVELTNDKVYGCDLIISATGVIPNTEVFTKSHQFAVGDDGGLLVNDQMQTNVPDVYAAGDVCTAGWEKSKHWFQMRLWTQARQMGAYAAICMVNNMAGESAIHDFCFEMFTHVTKFFGYKVVLLGLYNGQGLNKNYEILLRVTKGEEYIKTVMKDGRMQGAVLVGETGMEETFENLILNQMDLSQYGEDLLNPGVDIEDYFD